ncbi:hypothetical protein QCA50_007787 [Cerrena zonata]|uniref:AB hydrolase-1 domain-containing protein n=1 Tax=Cerrena zonata TaxID=2478898 RepID=A0AAW0G8M6_9APHY
MSASLFSKRFVTSFETEHGDKVTIVSARYSKVPNPSRHGRILICSHAVSTTKEHWIPVLERLFEQEELNISEAWAFDSPNHGDSLTYNSGLMNRPEVLNSLALCGDSLRALLRTGLIRYDKQEVIPIGHSAGTNAVVRAAMSYIHAGEPVPFKSAILIETVFLPEDIGLKVAKDFIHNYPAWKKWHKKSDISTLNRPMVHAVTGSQLKCPSHVEAACYPNADVQEQALKDLPIACEQINIHTIYGSKYDFVPKSIRDPFLSFAKKHVKSVTTIEGVGHMLVQEDPIKCSNALSDILRSIQATSLGFEQVQAKL